MSTLIVTIIITVAAGVIGIGSYYFLGPDNPVEEVAEEVIDHETGVDINLSPGAKPAPTPAPKATPSNPSNTSGV